MAYDLTINRFGALAGPHVKRAQSERHCDNKIIQLFQQQLQMMLDRGLVEKCHSRILEVVRAKSFLKDTADFAVPPIEVSTMPMDEGEKIAKAPTLIGLLPPKRMIFEDEGMEWILRVRPSVTACALQEKGGLSKLWWTFEGIPATDDPAVRPTEKQVSSFVGWTEKLEQKAMEPLYTLYRDTLRNVSEVPPKEFELGKERVQISMSDNDDRKVGSLLDALYLDGWEFEQIRDQDGKTPSLANQGLREFESLVSKITEYDPEASGNSVATVEKMPGYRALYYRHNHKEEDALQTVVAGLARRAENRPARHFLSPGRQRLEKSEDILRERSAARRISAMLCQNEARTLEAAHPHL